MKHVRMVGLFLGLWIVSARAEQHVLFDGDLTFGNDDGRLLLQFADPLDWKDGMLHRRLEVKSKPTTLDMGLQLCVWSGGETCSSCDPAFTGTGVYYTASNPAGWWKQAGDLSGWGSHGDRAYVLKTSDCQQWMATCGGWWCLGGGAAEHLPVTVHVTEMYTAPGEDFDCPEDWTGAPWPECASAPLAVRGAHRADPDAAIQVSRVTPEYMTVSVAQSKDISLYTTDGRRVTVTRNGPDEVRIHSGSAAAKVVLLRALTGEGIVSTKIVLGE